MAAFVGFVELEETAVWPLLTRDNQLQPGAADNPPTFRVYGPAGYFGVAGTVVAGDIAGLYTYTVAALSTSGFAAATAYYVLLSWTSAGVPAATLQTFMVN